LTHIVTKITEIVIGRVKFEPTSRNNVKFSKSEAYLQKLIVWKGTLAL
jgi:hypothetical protein